MKKITALFAVLLLLTAASVCSQPLVDDQLNYARVREAKADYHEELKQLLRTKGVAFPPKDIYLRAFKFDKEMELWATDGGKYRLIKTYDICQVSGELGPKRAQGDFQIPEGIYQLEYFNPASSFHLSMKVSYPNESDKILGNRDNLGGDIFIHGECVTIGCIPLENEPIKELYWLSVLTKSKGGTIPIHIFPFKMDAVSLQFFEDIPLFDHKDWYFWNQLIPVYTYFQKHRKLPRIEVTSNGNYVLSSLDSWVKN